MKKLEIIAVWVQAFGAFVAATANSAVNILNEDQIASIDIVGNVLQAAGNAVQADQQETVTFEKIGAEIQAIGNTVVASSYILLEEDFETNLIIKGNWLQAFGALIEAIDEVLDNTGPKQPLNIVGNTTQAVGNSFQAIGGKHILQDNEEKGLFLVISGSWIQVIGTILNAIGQTQEEKEESHQSYEYKDSNKSLSFYETENKRFWHQNNNARSL